LRFIALLLFDLLAKTPARESRLTEEQMQKRLVAGKKTGPQERRKIVEAHIGGVAQMLLCPSR
jgi:hypothetical protein